MESNAWERARDAIARASERDESVITPETAVSPFDVSSTMVIPHAAIGRPVGPPPGVAPWNGPRPGDGGPPVPRAPGDGLPHGNGINGRRPHLQDTGTDPPPPHSAPRSTHLPPEPPTRPVEVSDPRGVPARVAGARPPTAPFPSAGTEPHPTPPHATPSDPDTEPGTRPAEAPRRSWWRRVLGR